MAKVSRERIRAILAQMCLMDDEFFSEVLDGKIEAVQYILRTILERDDIFVKSVESQREYKSTAMRSVRLDIYAVDTEGRIMDIEIQRANDGSGAKRARYYSSMIDRTLLEKGAPFDALVDTYVIFITENDKFGYGLPLYHIDRTVRELQYAPFPDGTHILYVNGEFRDVTHPIGQLMHDFQCRDADRIYNRILAGEVKYIKEETGGNRSMSRLMEEYLNELIAEERAEFEERVAENAKRAEETAKRVEAETTKRVEAETAKRVEAETTKRVEEEKAVNMLKKGLAVDFVAECLSMQTEKVEEIAKKLSENP